MDMLTSASVAPVTQVTAAALIVGPAVALVGVIPTVKALDALRDSLGVSVPQLAGLIGNDRTHLWRVLHGHATATPDLVSRCLFALAGLVKTTPLPKIKAAAP